jgi:hypothetical protein
MGWDQIIMGHMEGDLAWNRKGVLLMLRVERKRERESKGL